jgi:4-amino-4-deoxy-L-arabinose transferase-like glycosyltransferase
VTARSRFAPLDVFTRGGGIAVGLLGFLTGLIMVVVVFDAQGFVRDRVDPYWFGDMGRSLARGDGLAAYGTLLMRRSPLYPFFIGGLFTVFGDHLRVIQLAQCVLLGITCWLVYDMGRRIFAPRVGVFAGIACAVHPMNLRYVADLHLETLLTCLVTLMVWNTIRFLEHPSPGRAALIGLAGGAASLTKAVMVLYPASFFGIWALLQLRQRSLGQILGFAVTAGLAMAMVIAPWTWRNYRVTGHFVPISSGFNDAFLRGYVFSELDYALLRKPPYTDAENRSNLWFQSIAREAGTVWQREDYETEQVLGRAAKAKLRAEPAEFVRKSVVGLFTFWYQMTSRVNSVITGCLALGALILAAVGWTHRGDRPVWALILPAAYLNLLLAVLLALGRYSAPILPSLMVASAFGLTILLDRRKPSSVRVSAR